MKQRYIIFHLPVLTNTGVKRILLFLALHTVYPFDQFLETKGAITRPEPIPIKMDATNNRADVLRNIKPTPTPIIVVPPITHELLSLFLSTSDTPLYSGFKNQASFDSSYDLNCQHLYSILVLIT